MNAPRACPTCGSPATLDDLCPACLLQQGLATQTLASGTPGTTRMPCPGEDFGPYRILRRLGGGGMGEVFEVEQRENGRRLALKVIAQDLASEQDRQRFLREGRLAASVSHPNVVYVYGSEEIEGTPAIAMELAPGGTLKDLVKKDRPLAPAAAVEATLQLIAGLEAAHAAGVLHRDIKPANCFRDADGGVKVGDFGLSIPADGRRDAQVTAPGSLLGSPAFASPEQLRGEALDVRSDIYSVGATLYYLLTARAPHEGDSVVNVIAAALDRDPPAPHTLNPAVPAGLSRLVMRCLAKMPGDRHATHAQLRDALLPFGSSADTPAPPGLRLVAGLADDLLLIGIPNLLFFAWAGQLADSLLLSTRTATAWLPWACGQLGAVLLYAFLEWRWGATPGKALCGLRVAGADRTRPGFARLCARAAMFVLIPAAGVCVDALGLTGEQYLRAVQRVETTRGEWIGFFIPPALFLTLRRRNGWAALHDLATGVRVVLTPRVQRRPALEIPPPPSLPATECRLYGPYAAAALLSAPGATPRILRARDEVLHRDVWVVEHPAEYPAISPERRDLARPARLRWLNGRRTESEAWDVFEAPDGLSLRELARRTDPAGKEPWPATGFAEWASVRFWLADLAHELAAGLRDGSLPPLSPDHVWITAQGRARLLDWPAPGTPAPPAEVLPATQEGAQHFLAGLADVCLGNTNPPPLAAAQLVGQLRKNSFPALELVEGNFASFVEKSPAVSRRRRFASLALVPGLAAAAGVLWAGISIFETGMYDRDWKRLHPNRPSPRQVVTAFFKHNGEPALAGEIGKFFRREYAAELADPGFVQKLDYVDRWNSELPWVADIQPAPSHPRPEISTEAPEPRPVEGLFDPLEPAANERVAAVLPSIRRFELEWMLRGSLIIPAIGLGLSAALGFLCALLGVTPLLRLFGIAVVDARGRLASRWRLLARWAVAWPGTMGFAWMSSRMFGHLLVGHRPDTAWMLQTGFPIGLGLVVLGSVLVMVLSPSRGFQDEQAGTWLVPR